MAITSKRLRQTFSEGGAQEIYRAVRATGDFLGFARQYVFDSDNRVARSALWGLTKATGEELSELQVLLNELIDQARCKVPAQKDSQRKNQIKQIWKLIVLYCALGANRMQRYYSNGLPIPMVI